MEKQREGYSVVRRVNKHGAITIPSFFRNDLKLRAGDPVELTVTTDGKLVIGKPIPACAFCGATEKLRIMEKGCICSKCFAACKGVKVQ